LSHRSSPQAAAVATYLLGGWFSSNFVLLFVLIALFHAFDFWTVKVRPVAAPHATRPQNVSGRLLVGLRWWNHVREDGTTHWVFESHPAPETTLRTPADSRVFWWGLYIPPIVWVTFCVLSFLRFAPDWLLVGLMGLAATGSNLWGYLRCAQEAEKRRRAAQEAPRDAGPLDNPFGALLLSPGGSAPASAAQFVGGALLSALMRGQTPAPAPAPAPAPVDNVI
jgi:hypothetical protein